MVAYTELTPTFTVNNVYSSEGTPYTGHSASSGAGMRDGIKNASNSVWASNTSNGTNNFIRVDLGAATRIGKIGVAPIPTAFDGWGQYYLNGAKLQYSSNGSTWIDVLTFAGILDGEYKEYIINISARYWRLWRDDDYLAISEFRLFTFASTIRNASTVASVALGSDTAWTNTTALLTNDYSVATVATFSGNSNTQLLRLTNFGFTSGDIPSNAVPLSIKLSLITSQSVSFGCFGNKLYLRNGSGQIGSNKWSTNYYPEQTYYPSINELLEVTWDPSEMGGLTQANIIASTFGIDLAFSGMSGGAVPMIDFAGIELTYIILKTKFQAFII